MPRTPSIAIPFKKTAELDWVRALRHYIARAFQEDPDAYSSDCQALQRMRQDMRGANADETGRDLIFRYYSHLETLEPRFRINEQGVKVTFRWTDAFTSESTQQHSLAFEKAGVLFNLAVAFGMHGASLFADLSSEMELTTVHMAGIYFQVAAERFHYINENFLHAPSLDLQQETVSVLNGIMLAQAQECALIKCRLEKKKDATLSKIAQQTALMYSGVFDNLKAIIDSHQLPRGWLLLVETKLRYYQALAQYHEAHAEDTKSRHGVAIGRYLLAEQHVREATKLVGQFAETFFSTSNLAEDLYPESVQGLQDLISSLAAKVSEELRKANHDNDVIYNDPVPSTSTLPLLEAASVVSNFDINKFYASEERSNVVGNELFSRLIPMAVHETSSLYSEEKAKMLRAEEDKVNLADGELQDALSFMKIPGSLRRFECPAAEVGSGTGASGLGAILSDFADPSKAVRDGVYGVQSAERSTPLAETRAQVEGQRSRANDEIAELSRMLDEEQKASDRALSEHASNPLFAGYQPSSRAASFYREQIADNQKKLDDAAGLDSSILSEYRAGVAAWLPTMQRGSDGVVSVLLEHLKDVNLDEAYSAQAMGGESLVDIGQDQPVGLSGYVQAIRDIYDQLLGLKTIRRTTLGELKAAAQDDDISNSLIKATSGKDLQALFARELKKYDPHVQRLQAASAKQGVLVKAISEEFRRLMELPQARVINDRWEVAESRKAAVESQLLDAVQVYSHVSDGLSKASRFYTMLNETLGPFHKQVGDFAATRAKQRDQLLKQTVQDSAARSQAALKERLNQYAASPTAQQQMVQQQPQQRTYQPPPVQNTYSAQLAPAPPAMAAGAQAVDIGQLANQTAQMSLGSPPAASSGLPMQHQQTLYSPNGASAPQYQPSAPHQQMGQQHYMATQPAQQQQPHAYAAPGAAYQPASPSTNPAYTLAGASAPYAPAPLPAPEAAADPYAAKVRRSTALEPNGAQNIASSSYKPGYGGYMPTAAPLQQPAAGPAPSYGAAAGGYATNVSGPAGASPRYDPAPLTTHHQPAFGGYSEAQAANMSLSISHQPMAPPAGAGYVPPAYAPHTQSQPQQYPQQHQQPQMHAPYQHYSSVDQGLPPPIPASAVPASLGYQPPQYIQQPAQQYASQPPALYQQHPPPQQPHQPQSAGLGYGYQYSNQAHAPLASPLAAPYAGLPMASQQPPLHQMAPHVYFPQQQQQQPQPQPQLPYLPPVSQQQAQPRQQSYHHGYGGNHGSLMD
ncbi:bck1-like resistance to osmotic shock [Coemansia thaxteri]|uniref:BRO domain-containing protein 1 n=1 Tax=Coemansia thaxteri TaxID=2663907 RepID=A0A9W8EGT8_9FUNG|nr:bck1-like resistance to osmotic shock [Coemansia thaxteri]